MRLIKQYAPPISLRDYALNYQDREEFQKLSIKDELLERLCNYLNKTNQEVIVNEVYDGQSRWRGFEFYIDGIDLSRNGFCFSIDKLSDHLKEKGH